MTLYRNENTGDVFDATDPDDLADFGARANWHEVSEEDAKKPHAEWFKTVQDAGSNLDVNGLLEDGLIPTDGKKVSAVDVPQSGPTGSKARGNRAPAKGTSPAVETVVAKAPIEVSDPEGIARAAEKAAK